MKNLGFVALCTLFLSLGVLTSIGMRFYLSQTDSELDEVLPITTNGKEIALIFFGCSTCSAATEDRLQAVLKELTANIREKAKQSGHGFTTIGISNEVNIDQGLSYLKNMANFDEISVGNSMANRAIQFYVWETFDDPLSGATPQVILTERIYREMTNGIESVLSKEIESERILLRRIGHDAIGDILNSPILLNDIF